MAAPGDVDRWWRHRSAMRLVADRSGWRVIGSERARARVAYASLDLEQDRVVYEVEPA
jgi:hypothetical protein